MKLASGHFRCLKCESRLNLRGRHAQAVADSGICPICQWKGAVTLTSYKVAVEIRAGRR
jgi:hypothetical protein